MKVAEEMAELRARINHLKSAKCAACGHPFVDHGGRCYYPRTQRDNGPKIPRCRCRAWTDVEDVLT